MIPVCFPCSTSRGRWHAHRCSVGSPAETRGASNGAFKHPPKPPEKPEGSVLLCSGPEVGTPLHSLLLGLLWSFELIKARMIFQDELKQRGRC